MLHGLRPHGELAVEQTERGIKVVVGPPGAPVAVAYRNSMFYLKVAETSTTQESLCILVVVMFQLPLL